MTGVIAVLAAATDVSVASAAHGKVLVFGSADNGTEGDNVASTLSSLGYGVDRRDDLPDDLSPYSSVWYIEAYQGLSDGAEAELDAYIEGGGSVYLTGERPCCEELNPSDEAILRAVLVNKAVTVGGLGDIGGPFTFNPSAEDQVASSPNTLVDFVPNSPGGMAGIGGVADQNVFASNGSIPVGAVFDERDMSDGEGRVAILMDIDWLTSDARLPIIENIQNFLDHGLGCTNDGPEGDDGFKWTKGPHNCTVLTTPSAVSWSASTSHGHVAFNVTSSEVTANCSSSQSGTSTVESCSLSGASATGSLQITATDDVGSVTRRYRVRPKNDPRNVPPGYALDSNWWDWPDSDQDGLPDFWEEEGVWVSDKYLDLPAFGADPSHKDLFLHYDFEEGYELDSEVFTDMAEAFEKGPLSNPDGTDGVHLHFNLGSEIPASIVGHFKLSQSDIQKVAAYSGFANSPEIGGGGVPQIFHWMLNFDSTGSNVIGASIVGGDFGFTAFPVDPWKAALEIGTVPSAAAAFAQASNATHELGHQLGLRHRGTQDFPNNDPKYKSVMSYAYSNFGVPGGAFGLSHRIDYSRTNDVNQDWRMGKGDGRLTFVHGQWGEEPDFYAFSANELIDASGPEPSELTIKEALAAAAPESVEGFVKSFAPEAHPDIPTLSNAEVTAQAGASIDIPLHGIDPASAPLEYAVVGNPAIGSASSSPDGIGYRSPAGASGDDTVVVRATNGTFSSGAALVTIHLSSAATATTAPSGSVPAPVSKPVSKATGKPKCRKGFRRRTVKGKSQCRRIKHHHKPTHRHH